MDEGTPPTRLRKKPTKAETRDKRASVLSDTRSPPPIDKPRSAAALALEKNNPHKWRRLQTRTVWTILMIALFVVVVLGGPLTLILLVIGVQLAVFREVIGIAHAPSKEKRLPWFRTITWYFLFSTTYFVYGESLIFYLQKHAIAEGMLSSFVKHHRMISFTLYIIGFIAFVLNLKKGHYRFQFRQLGFTHMALLLIVCQSHFIINNIFEGIIWFVLPISLVIVNDIAAYLCGLAFGKTPLIKLSPRKTWEGFGGGMLVTMVFSFFFSRLLSRFPYMTSPVDAVLNHGANPLFVPCEYSLRWLKGMIFPSTITVAPIQWHSLALACFASVIAPFGGFFASGYKRAFKIKDFSDSIPGHGGITDRMDCQFLMGLFSYLYLTTFVKTQRINVGHALNMVITEMDQSAQVELFHRLQQYLIGQHLIEH